MIDPVNESDVRTGARLLDFFDARSPWNRRLWHVGLSLTLREVLEAAEAVSAGVLSEQSMGFLANVAQKMVGTDPGAGNTEERKLLQRNLKREVRPDSLKYQVVKEQESRLRDGYLARWALALRCPCPPRAEQAARAVASHLLDIGYSADYLHGWWKYRLNHEAGFRALADIIDDAQQLARSTERNFDVMVPVSRAVRLPDAAELPPEWRSPGQVSAWFQANNYGAERVRQAGGFLFGVNALDADAAVARVSELLDQLGARVAIGTKRDLKLLGEVWIGGTTTRVRLDRGRRGVWVKALEREGQLFDVHSSGRIHAAIELLSHLQSSSPGAAVAGGWAAIEALLSEPGGDRVEAADRLATLVACSYPRAELTALSYAISCDDRGFAARLEGVHENRLRCEIVADALLEGALAANGLRAPVSAAAARALEMLRHPRRTLALVQEHAANAFRRLYRQRNMVLHGARMDAVALRASLRTASPLVGAGIDRIIHAHYVGNVAPLPLTARAEIALATIGTAAGPRITTLLDKDS